MTSAARASLNGVIAVDTDEWSRRASSFGSVAAQYAALRPEYPADAVRWCVTPTGRDLAGMRVLDLAAGTGKLAGLLAGLGADVTAVEPDDEMRAEFARAFPGVQARPGRAEEIPLPDGSVDAVLCGQAMHWFDLPRALPEIARVLVPGGVLGALWNSDDDRVPWVAGLREAAGDAASPSVSRNRRGAEFSPERFAGAQAGADLFGPPERADFPNSQRLTAETLVELAGTHSHVVVMDPAERAQRLDGIRAFLAATPETAAGEFDLALVTTVLRVVRRR